MARHGGAPSGALAVAALVAVAVVYGVWRYLGRGKWRGVPLVDADGAVVEAPSGDEQADQWAAYLNLDATWVRANIDRLEDEAIDAGAPARWWALGWETALGPPDARFRFAGPAFRTAPKA